MKLPTGFGGWRLSRLRFTLSPPLSPPPRRPGKPKSHPCRHSEPKRGPRGHGVPEAAPDRPGKPKSAPCRHSEPKRGPVVMACPIPSLSERARRHPSRIVRGRPNPPLGAKACLEPLSIFMACRLPILSWPGLTRPSCAPGSASRRGLRNVRRVYLHRDQPTRRYSPCRSYKQSCPAYLAA